jgi:small ligand-binding sensory domain FIST
MTVRVATGAAVDRDAGVATQVALREVVDGLDGAAVDLAVVFLGGAHAGAADAVAEQVAGRLRPGALLGVTAGGVVADAAEIERADAVSVWAASLPGARVTPLRYPAHDPTAPDVGLAWPEVPGDADALLLLAEPFSHPTDAFLAWLAQQHPGLPVAGGLASGAARPGGNRLLLDGVVHDDGAVGVALAGVGLRFCVSQGCRPVGSSWVVTRAERNVIAELGGVPAAERIREAYEQADPVDRELMHSGLQVGIAIDEYADSHERGDFLIRGVIGAEPSTGALAVGDLVRVGQTVRFQVRDARSADEDLRESLAGVVGPEVAGALLFTCNGRGSRLFGVADHDAGLVRTAVRGAPVAGFFAAGEIGPVGDRSHLHGFTASLVLIDARNAGETAD